MPETRKKKNHNKKVKIRNQKQKSKQMSENQEVAVQPVPSWSSKEEFIISGLELDYIYNYLTSVQPALAAATSILNRGIMAGKIKMKWQQQNPDGTTKELSADEAKPHQEEFDKMIAAVKNGEQPQVQTELTEDTLEVTPVVE